MCKLVTGFRTKKVSTFFRTIHTDHISNGQRVSRHSLPTLLYFLFSPPHIFLIQFYCHRTNGTFGFADDPELQLDCFVGRDESFKDTFGRLWWNRPSPTITTKFFSISNGRFVHPEEDRALSIREGATLQSFPKNYIFKTSSIAKTARMIGNAVPPKYAEAIGKAIIQNSEK